MVRKSLAETLTAQAQEFLEQGRPKPASQPLPEPPSSSPLNGIDRVLDTGFWTAAEQASLKDALLDRYRDSLTAVGLRVTSSGIVDSAGGGAPSTRSVEKELRVLRREVGVLADVVRALLELSVQVGGRSPADMQKLITAVKAPAKSQPASAGTEATPEAAAKDETKPEPQPAAQATGATAKQEPAAETPVVENGNGSHAPKTEPAPEPAPALVEEEDDDDAFFSSFRRPVARTASPPAAEAPRVRPAASQAPERAERVRPKEKPRERVPRRDLWKERVPERTKTCPRCSREVSIRVPRCLSCGKTF